MKRIVINKDILQTLCKSLPSPGESSRDNTGQSFFKTNSTPTDFIVHGSDGKKAVEEWDKLCASQTLGSSCTITKPKQQKNPIISSEKGQTLGSSGNITKSKFQPPQKQQQKKHHQFNRKGVNYTI
ncbi:uncharacterized protein LOC130647206 [Hydractinia symbiolongicarpus]|uniref:uncharacterized protein LOC130647206 n=1 Tax=Hydractinia symbiolongicarpus TaxID=13093 RepID=UPI00254D42B2|nr:uncharacterized protein LOC130647206 [Hydractinia symbiolongicarpus]